MAKTQKRKAFTIVELVIVIAVIAILAAVMIPTFSGIIESAKVSNDRVTEKTFNTAIEVYKSNGKQINDVTDLKAAIDSVHSEGFFDKIKPESAEYGYHFWYNVADQKVVLAKEPPKGDNSEEINSNEDNIDFALAADSEIEALAIENKIETSFLRRQAEIFDGNFLLDREGSALAEILTTIGDKDTDAAKFDEALGKIAKLGNDKHDKNLATVVAEMVNDTAFSNENGTFRNVAGATKLVIAAGANMISGQIFEHDGVVVDPEAKSGIVASVTGTILLPDHVGQITGGFDFEEDKVTIHVEYKEEELGNILSAGATNATITIPSVTDAAYKVVESEIIKVFDDETKENEKLDVELSVGIKVTDFEILSDINYFYAADKLPAEAIEISVGNFKGEGDKEPSNKKILWTVDNDNYATVVDGAIILKDAAKTANTITVTAKAVYGDNVAKEVKINIVRIVAIQLSTSKIEKSYTANDETKTPVTVTATAFKYNFEGLADDIMNACNKTLTYTSSNNSVFTVLDGTVSFAGFNSLNGNGEAIPETLTVALANNPSVKATVEVVYTEDIVDIIKLKDEFNEAFKETLGNEYKGDFLFRVGNANEFNISLFFEEIEAVQGVEYKLTVYDAAQTTDGGKTKVEINGLYGFDGEIKTDANLNTTYQFSGTGVAILELSAIKNGKTVQSVSKAVEVVEAKNATNYIDISGHGTNSLVMLNDIKMSEVGMLVFENCNLYGNGYTLDVTNGAYGNTSGGSDSNNYVINLKNAHLDNTVITGAVYTSYGATTKADYNFPLILVYKSSAKITNCVISNCATPIRVFGPAELEIKDSVLRGGAFANLDIRSGTITLDNVTTVNNANDNDKAADGSTIVGLGITVYYENVLSDTKIILKNGLKQYNYINNSTDKFNIVDNDYTELLFDKIFGMTESEDFKVYYTDGDGVKWINAGILSISGDIVNSNNIDVTGFVDKDNYNGKSETFSVVGTSADTYMYLPKGSAPKYYDGSHAFGYEVIEPIFKFDFSSQEIEKNDGVLKYLYEKDGVIYIGVDADNTVDFNFISGVVCSKYGENLTVNVTYDGNSISSKTFITTDKGTHTLVYTVTDQTFYDNNGNPVTSSVTYTEELEISVAITSHKSAEFSINTDVDGVTENPDGSYTITKTDYKYSSGLNLGSWSKASYKLMVPIIEYMSITDYDEYGKAIEIMPYSDTTIPDGLTFNLANFTPNGETFTNTYITSGGIYYLVSDTEAYKGNHSGTLTYSYQGNNGETVELKITFVWTN